MTATPQLPFRSVEAHFMARTGSIYDSMTKRFAQRENKRGRITQIGRKIPFTKDEFRDWLRERLGGEGGVVQCAYCSTWVSAADFSLDHCVPVGRGGLLGLENLTVCCQPCNQIKGRMLAESYRKLRTFLLLEIHPECCQNVLQRLQSAVSLGAWQRREMARQAKKQAVAPPKEEEF